MDDLRVKVNATIPPKENTILPNHSTVITLPDLNVTDADLEAINQGKLVLNVFLIATYEDEALEGNGYWVTEFCGYYLLTFSYWAGQHCDEQMGSVAGRHPRRAGAAAAFRSQPCDHQVAIMQHDSGLSETEKFRDLPNKLTGACHQSHRLYKCVPFIFYQNGAILCIITVTIASVASRIRSGRRERRGAPMAQMINEVFFPMNYRNRPLVVMPFFYSSGEEIRKGDVCSCMGNQVKLNLSPIRLKVLMTGW
jgi:hypothetical protein